MSKVICVAHQKGGVGKSLISLNLANCFQNQLKVAIMDCDFQGSLIEMSSNYKGINFLNFESDFDKLTKNDFDIVIIDTPPYLSNKLPLLFENADFVLVPTKAGFFDLMAIKATLKMIRNSQKKKESLKAGIVFNLVKHNSSLSKELMNLLDLEEIQVLKSIITDRVSYSRSVLDGGIFFSNDEKAKSEIIHLADEILNNMCI